MTRVKTVPWKGNSQTDSVFSGISYDHVTQQLMRNSEVVENEFVLLHPKEPELLLCHLPFLLPYVFYTYQPSWCPSTLISHQLQILPDQCTNYLR